MYLFFLRLKVNRLPFELLVYLGKVIFPKYRFKWHQLDWWESDKFDGYLKRFDNYKKMNDDRLWNLAQILRLVSFVPGDTAECGVFKGASSYLICRANVESELDKTHCIFDSFEGVSTPDSEVDGTHWSKGDLACSLDVVKQNLSDFSLIEYFQGWIPDRFGEVLDRSFSFVHIDVDLMQPTADSFSFFYERMSEGGVIVCDDYGQSTCPGATKAIDLFLADKDEKMISLCSSGGFMIKGVRASAGCFS